MLRICDSWRNDQILYFNGDESDKSIHRFSPGCGYAAKCHTKQSRFLDCSESDISLLADLKEPLLSLHCHWNICACACAHVCQRRLHKYPFSPSWMTLFRLCETEDSERSRSTSLTFWCHFCYRLHTNYINDCINVSTTFLAHYRYSGTRFLQGLSALWVMTFKLTCPDSNTLKLKSQHA